MITHHFQKEAFKVTVLGAGAFGTALAIHLGRYGPVKLWGRTVDQMQTLQNKRVNQKYLPNALLPDAVDCTFDLKETIQSSNAILVAVPSLGLSTLFEQILPFINNKTNLLVATKGFYPDTGELLSQWLAKLEIPWGLLSGPSFAKEVAQQLPVKIVLASQHANCITPWKARLHQPHFQIETTQDVTGVALCGAMKNVIAIAVGMAEGLALGKNMGALLITQGLAEMGRLGEKLLADPSTFVGPAGIGDLSLTCMSSQSRNQRLGVFLGQGLSLKEAAHQLGLLSEGSLNVKAVYQLAKSKCLTLPLCEMVYTVIVNKLSCREAIDRFINQLQSYVSK